jgi:hypothetical protein
VLLPLLDMTLAVGRRPPPGPAARAPPPGRRRARGFLRRGQGSCWSGSAAPCDRPRQPSAVITAGKLQLPEVQGSGSEHPCDRLSIQMQGQTGLRSIHPKAATSGPVPALNGSSQLRSYTAQANRTRNCSDPDFRSSPYLLKSAFISDVSASRCLASSFATIQSSCCLFPAGAASS